MINFNLEGNNSMETLIAIKIQKDRQYCDKNCPYLAEDSLGKPLCELFRYYHSDTFPNKSTPLYNDGTGNRRLASCIDSEKVQK